MSSQMRAQSYKVFTSQPNKMLKNDTLCTKRRFCAKAEM